jgi:hypothetical protein
VRTLNTQAFRESFNYSRSESGIEVPISLVNAGRTVRLLAKIDTGAAFCIFQREYAEQLGLDVETGIRLTMSTATGSFETYGHTVTLTCFDWSFETCLYFAAETQFSRNVVGRVGWLQYLRIGIIDHDALLLLSHYDD